MENLSDKDSINKYLGEYISVSLEKEKLSKDIFKAEKDFETIEGSAQYIGIRAGELTNHHLPFIEGIEKDKDRSFYKLFPVISNYDGYTSELKWIRYDTGALLLTALDRLDYDYQDRLENSTIYAEVYKYLKENPDLLIGDIEELKDKYDLDEISNLSKKILDKL